jgi:hypothetical protein
MERRQRVRHQVVTAPAVGLLIYSSQALVIAATGKKLTMSHVYSPKIEEVKQNWLTHCTFWCPRTEWTRSKNVRDDNTLYSEKMDQTVCALPIPSGEVGSTRRQDSEEMIDFLLVWEIACIPDQYRYSGILFVFTTFVSHYDCRNLPSFVKVT